MLTNLFIDQTAARHNLPPEVLGAVAWQENHTMPNTIGAAGNIIGQEFKKTGHMNEALYNYHFNHNKDVAAATEFTENVLSAAGYSAPKSSGNPSWFDKFMAQRDPDTAPKENPDIVNMSNKPAWLVSIEKYIGSVGIVLLGIAIIVVALLMNKPIRKAAVTAVKK